jgi:hypothetical protein
MRAIATMAEQQMKREQAEEARLEARPVRPCSLVAGAKTFIYARRLISTSLPPRQALERRLGAYRARLGRSSAASSGSPLSRSQSHSNLLEPFARGAGGWDELEPEVRSLLHWSPYDRVGVVDAVS